MAIRSTREMLASGRKLPKLLVWADGTPTGGGKGAENIVYHAHTTGHDHDLNAVVVGFVSRHATGGVHELAKRLGVPFCHFSLPTGRTPGGYYAEIADKFDTEWHMLSGWPLPVPVRNLACAHGTSFGLDPRRTVNIHPGDLTVRRRDGTPRFGGRHMHNMRVHTAVWAAMQNGELGDNPHSGFTMHFVDYRKLGEDPYDKGPIIEVARVPIGDCTCPDDIRKAVNAAEHQHQPRILDKVLRGDVSWDGINCSSLCRAA